MAELKKKSKKPTTVNFQLIKEQPTKTPHTAAYFPSGFNPITNQSSVSVSTHRNHKKPRRLELVVKPKFGGSKVDYVGTNYSGEAAAKVANYGLAVFDKAAKKLTFLPLVSNKVLRLEPKVTAVDISEKEPATPAKTEKTAMEALNTLTSMFGTKDQLKQAKRAQRLMRKENPDAHEELTQILEDTPIDKAALASANTETNRNVPPHDLSATTADRAYPLEKIILPGEWNHVKDLLELLQAGEEIRSDVYPSSVCNRFRELAALQKDETKMRENLKKAQILSYITHLINFKDKNSLDGFSSSKHHKIPDMLFQKFTKMFVNSDKNRLSDEKIGALVNYVLVLTLHVDEFLTNFEDIAKDLKMSAGSLRPYFENLGCKFRRRNNATVATLPVPLVFPTLRKRKRRG